MSRIRIFIICIFLFCSVAKPYDLNEKIVIEGSGSLSSYTDIPNARDSIESNGNYHNYDRKFSINGEFSSLISNYELINNLNKPSSYLIAMDGKNEGLEHIVEISGNSDIISTCAIARSISGISEDNIKLSSNFNISGHGKLKESIIDLKSNTHPMNIVGTIAEGESVFLVSNLTESAFGPSKLPKTGAIKSVGNTPKEKTTEVTNEAWPGMSTT